MNHLPVVAVCQMATMAAAQEVFDSIVVQCLVEIGADCFDASEYLDFAIKISIYLDVA